MRTVLACRQTHAASLQKSVALQLACLALGCALCAKFVFTYAQVFSGAFILWLPNAVVLSAMLLSSYRQWWKFALTQFACELLLGADNAAAPLAVGYALLNLLEVLLSALLLRRMGGRQFAFCNAREMLLFAAVAMAFVPALTTGLGAWMYRTTAQAPMPLLQHWQIGWIGHGAGMAALTPLLFGWLCRTGETPAQADSTRLPEKLAYTALLAALLQALFFGVPEAALLWQVGPLLLLALVLWAAMRFGVLGVSAVGCMVSLLAIVQTGQGRGMFAAFQADMQAQVLQQYLAAMLLTGLAVAGLSSELRGKVRSLRRLKQKLLNAHTDLSLLNEHLEQRVTQRTAELERLATTDALTDTHNRRFLMARAEIELALAKRQSHAVSMVMFDIDHFKRVNDSHGHNVGDRVLVALTQAVKKEMRLGDTFARVGGEEFVMLLPHLDAEQARQVAERLRTMLEALEIHAGPGLVLHITASFGVATLSARISTVEALCVAADTALYQAKAAGRNCVVSDRPTVYSS